MKHLAANYIFTGNKLIKNGIVSVSNEGEIVYASSSEEKIKERQRMIFYNGIICPGFVNAHSHIELSSLKGKLQLNQGLSKFISDISNLKDGIIKKTSDIAGADKAMFNNGINAVGDIINTNVSLEEKKNSNIFYHNYIEVYGTNEKNADHIINNAIILENECKRKGLSCSITPHSFYSVSKKLFENINNTNSKTLSIHFLESIEEYNFFKNQSGKLYKLILNFYPHLKSNIKTIEDLYLTVNKLISDGKGLQLVHNTVADEEMLTPAKHLFLCLCPNSNLLISGVLPSKELLKNKSYNFTVGTDSLASNNQLCILSEIRTIGLNYQDIPLEDLLTWATSNGAKALNIDNEYGYLRKNTKPGIILLENIDLQNLKIKNNTTVKRLF